MPTYSRILDALQTVLQECDVADEQTLLIIEKVIYDLEYNTQILSENQELRKEVAQHLGVIGRRQAGSIEHKILLCLNELALEKHEPEKTWSNFTGKERYARALDYLADAIALKAGQEARTHFLEAA